MLQRPNACRLCPLDTQASGFAPPEGPLSPLAFMGEALGKTEAQHGRPFVGDAGAMLQRLFNLLGWDRSAFRIFNTISCRPPNDWFDPRAPYFYDALNHCAVHREPVLAAGHSVIVALGGVAMRTLLGLHHAKKASVENFHGTVLRDPTDRFWVVPTFHPSFLQRGAHNLIGTVLWDLQQAEKAITHGKPVDNGTLVVDPPVEWFRAWVDMVIAARVQDRDAYPISSDVETPDKAGGRDEGEITVDDVSFEILRQNVSCNPDEGVTVPNAGPYLDELKRLYASPGMIWQWNKGYDTPRQIAAGQLRPEDEHRVLDLMWLWHFFQSDLPRGLGFVAPFYSSYGPWKHLADLDPAKYGAIDGLQTHRCGFGILRDLQQLGMLKDAMRHVHQLHHQVLKPAQDVGVRIDRDRLLAFKEDLGQKATRSLDQILACVPEELQPLSPKDGLVSRPASVLHVKATAFTRKGTKRKGRPASDTKMDLYKRAVVIEKLVIKPVLICETCKDVDVHRKHRCRLAYTKKDGTIGWKPSPETATITVGMRSVTRYYWQEPFNPDSWQQVLAYIKHRKHTPGRAKKTHKESTDRETLERLQKTGDPFYGHLLDYRAVIKVKGTYVDGTERRLDAHDRIHPEPTFKPSTMRLSYVNPNITNVVTRAKEGKENLAAGYRRCVVAGNERPADVSDAELAQWMEKWG